MNSDWIRAIATPPGEAGSGRVRYAAAMGLHRDGMIGDRVLEIYRISAADDTQDPAVMIAAEGFALPQAEAAIRTLVAQADAYLATRAGPGIGDVRAGIASVPSAAVISVAAQLHPVVAAHLGPALAAVRTEWPALAAAIEAAAPHLRWSPYDQYSRDAIGADFANGHAFATIIGEDAPIRTAGYDFGLFLIAPGVLYRDRCHAAPELYAPLTGPHGWRFGPGAALIEKPAHVPVWNPPFQPHLTKVGPLPFLCLFCWTADVNEPARVIPASDWPVLEAWRIGDAPRTDEARLP
jgi:Dimethlysulfonioproprionate lyase